MAPISRHCDPVINCWPIVEAADNHWIFPVRVVQPDLSDVGTEYPIHSAYGRGIAVCPGQFVVGTVDQAFSTRYSVLAQELEHPVLLGLLAIPVESGESSDAGADYQRNCGDEQCSVHEVLRSDLPSVSIISA